MFHWKDNIFFGRMADGSVRVVKFFANPQEWPKADAPSYCGDKASFDVAIPAAEWASVMSSVSKGGEAQNYQRAVELHSA